MTIRDSPQPAREGPGKRVLILAYACRPGEGSEPGFGWNIVLRMARQTPLWVLTPAENRIPIEHYERDHGATGTRWIYLDVVPRRGLGRVVAGRTTYGDRLHHLLWQCALPRAVRAALATNPIELVHHLTYGGIYYPSPVWSLRIPTLFGPLGGSMTPASVFWQYCSARERCKEFARLALQTCATPILRRIYARAGHVIFVSRESATRLGGAAGHWSVLSQVGLVEDVIERAGRKEAEPRERRPFTVAAAGRLTGWKGVGLALLAFRELVKRIPNARLLIIGSGPESTFLRTRIARWGLTSSVTMAEFMARDAYIETLAGVSALVFAGSHEPGAYVIADALALGIPVVAIGCGERLTLLPNDSSALIPPGRRSVMVAAIAERLHRVAADAAQARRDADAARERVLGSLTWESKIDVLLRLYEHIAPGARPSA